MHDEMNVQYNIIELKLLNTENSEMFVRKLSNL